MQVLILIAFLAFLSPHTSFATQGINSAVTQEIKVTLFGQPCFLSGIYEVSFLKYIHSISPEQLPPMPKKEQLIQLIEKLDNPPKLLKSLEIFDSYLERFKKRALALLALQDGIGLTKKNNTVDSLISHVQKHLKSKQNEKDFETLVKKFESQTPVIKWNSMIED
ncbi:MAG: hypothetical protein HY843_04860, partial [Bdellovibrio sp.]|nr:hypothetical protein [Bdellovibrio sp.]